MKSVHRAFVGEMWSVLIYVSEYLLATVKFKSPVSKMLGIAWALSQTSIIKWFHQKKYSASVLDLCLDKGGARQLGQLELIA